MKWFLYTAVTYCYINKCDEECLYGLQMAVYLTTLYNMACFDVKRLENDTEAYGYQIRKVDRNETGCIRLP